MKNNHLFNRLPYLFIVFLLFSLSASAQVGIGTTSPTAQLTVMEDAIFNESGGNHDFRVEGNTNTNLFFIDGSADAIGFNTATPNSQIQLIANNSTGWITQWDNNNNDGGLARFQHSATSNGSRVLMGTTNYNASAFEAAGVIGLSLNGTVTGTGGIGVIGAANNESSNAVEGQLAFTGAYAGYAGYFNADVYSGGFYYGSDRRLKRDIHPLNNALSLIAQINPVSYYYDTEKYPGIGFDENRLSYGFIAQDLEQVIPEMVKDKNLVLNASTQKKSDFITERKTEEFKVVNYTLMIPFLTQAIKEQQVIIENQNNRILTLEDKIALLESRLNALIENQD